MLRLVKKHNIDLLGLHETHLHDQGVLDAQAWWLRKNGFAAMFNRQLDQSDKGSPGLVWRESKWEHVSSVAMGQRFLISHMRAKVGGDLRVLTGHFSCDPSQRRQQWEPSCRQCHHSRWWFWRTITVLWFRGWTLRPSTRRYRQWCQQGKWRGRS